MPRLRRREKISGYHLERFEQEVRTLESVMRDIEISLNLGDHYRALGDLRVAIKRALNVLNGRPADHEEPHHAPMSRGRDMSQPGAIERPSSQLPGDSA